MFRSFYLAGFECATGYNMHGEWIDQIAATEHDHHVDADYARLDEVGIHAVREAIRWPLVDRAGRYDFSTVQPFVDAALRHDFDVIWDLFHYGYPDDIDPFSEAFAERFAHYCYAAARYVRRHMGHRTCYFTPVNEPSYFAWAAGEVGRFAPYATNRGFELKLSLARVALRGIAAIREACPEARIVNVDPICRVVTDSVDETARAHVQRFNDEWVFQFWDTVSGRIMPELGGSPANLDIIGLNYYWTNQWELGREEAPLAPDDARRTPLAELICAVWRRYGAPIVITETSALDEARAPWIHELSAMAEQLLEEGTQLEGICLYPILGMPEWHDRDQWPRMGLWDLEREQDVLLRKTCAPMLIALRAAQRRQQLQSAGSEQVFTLLRTGDVPLVVYGREVWQRTHDDLGYRIRLIRSDQPYRRWFAAVELWRGETTIEHVATAAELALVLEQLCALDPRSIADQHGVSLLDRAGRINARWRRDVQEMTAGAHSFEAVPIAVRAGAPELRVPGGGRSG